MPLQRASVLTLSRMRSIHLGKSQKCEGFSSTSQKLLTSGKGREQIKLSPFLAQMECPKVKLMWLLRGQSYEMAATLAMASLITRHHIITSSCLISLPLSDTPVDWDCISLSSSSIWFYASGSASCWTQYKLHRKEEFLNFRPLGQTSNTYHLNKLL